MTKSSSLQETSAGRRYGGGVIGDQLVADGLLLFTSPKILFFKETCNLVFLEFDAVNLEIVFSLVYVTA